MLRQKIKVLTAFLFVALVAIAVLVGVIISSKPYKQVAKTTSDWEIGAFTQTGSKLYSSSSIRTKKFLDANGLEFELAEDSTITYQVVYFDKDKKFVGMSNAISDNDTERVVTFAEGKTEDNVALCKVVISPNADYYGEEEIVIKGGSNGNLKSFVNQIVLKYAKDTVK